MEGKRNSEGRRISRCHEANRLEEQLWALAYEQVWPLIRRAVTENRRALRPKAAEPANDLVIIARGA